jgi:hypothetical protein
MFGDNLMKSISQWILMFIILCISDSNSVFAQLEATIGTGSMTMIISEINRTETIRTVVFPREYSVYTQLLQIGRSEGNMGCVYGGGFLIAARNVVQDTIIIPYFISEATTNYYMNLQSTVPYEMKRYWKYQAPLRIVNDENFSDPEWQVYDEVGGSGMVSTQMVVAKCNTSSGITLTQRAYAFENQEFDDFVIVEYIFKNTGNINNNPVIEYPNNEVQECYFGLKFVPQPSWLTRRIIPNSGGWNVQGDDWIDYYTGDYNGESIRVLYGWDGDASVSVYSDDDEGDPYRGYSGIFMSPQYPGMAILHVDRAVDDKNNDFTQPLMNYYSYGGASSSNALSLAEQGFGENGGQDIFNILSTPAFFTSPFDWETWNSSQTEIWAVDNDPNREFYKTGTLGFGPFNFNNIGDSVRIITCYTVGSMGWQKSVEIGEQWKNNQISQTDKNRWIRSGRDSLFTQISRISHLFLDDTGNFDLNKGAAIIEDPPEPPGLITKSLVRSIEVNFTNVGAAKYRIYRRLKPVFYLSDIATELLKEPYPLIEELDPVNLSLMM